MSKRPTVAIVDYGMGNLFSVRQACEFAGVEGVISSDPDQVRDADALILPGVGAFGSAMKTLNSSGLSDAIREFIAAGRPFLGVCLGIQLLMSESEEFGRHAGLGVIPGRAVGFQPIVTDDEIVKVPQMQWNSISASRPGCWSGTPLEGLRDGEFMYFVHSYYVVPDDRSVVIATSRYADVDFCSALQRDNIFACQFHPERSGHAGLQIYRSIARRLGAGTATRMKGIS